MECPLCSALRLIAFDVQLGDESRADSWPSALPTPHSPPPPPLSILGDRHLSCTSVGPCLSPSLFLCLTGACSKAPCSCLSVSSSSAFQARCLTAALCHTGSVLSIIIYLLPATLHLTSLFHQLWIDYWMGTSARACTHLVAEIRSSIKLLFIVRPKLRCEEL